MDDTALQQLPGDGAVPTVVPESDEDTTKNPAPINNNEKVLQEIESLRRIILSDPDVDFSFLRSGVIEMLEQVFAFVNNPAEYVVDESDSEKFER